MEEYHNHGEFQNVFYISQKYPIQDLLSCSHFRLGLNKPGTFLPNFCMIRKIDDYRILVLNNYRKSKIGYDLLALDPSQAHIMSLQ